MYLTHFGAVNDVSRLMGDLREGIRAHHRIAAQSRDAPDPAAAIRSGLEAWFTNCVIDHGLSSPQEWVAGVLALDLELNAQGLLAWQERNPA
jgi:hypothetical protein